MGRLYHIYIMVPACPLGVGVKAGSQDVRLTPLGSPATHHLAQAICHIRSGLMEKIVKPSAEDRRGHCTLVSTFCTFLLRSSIRSL